MGTWGAKVFEDDTAMEFYDEFCYSEQSIEELEDGLDTVLSQTYDMDDLLMEGFEEPIKALVYAEIIATINGKPSDKLPDDEYHEDMELPKINFEKLKLDLKSDLKMKAIETITKIQEDDKMHLTVLWMESESLAAWQQNLNDLKQRLA